MKRYIVFPVLVITIALVINSCGYKNGNTNANKIIIENAEMRLLLGRDGKAISLIHKSTGQECLQPGIKVAAFSITQNRPYDNELQLKYPANPKIFCADSVYRNGDDLIVSFELINIVATIGLNITDHYIGFTLKNLDYRIPSFGDNRKTSVDELVLLQLPVKDRENFGEWLNVVWDKDLAVNLLGTDPFARIDAVKCEHYHLLRARADFEVNGIGTGAALITTSKNNLLNCIDWVEKDFNLPRGVESRQRKGYKYSYYETGDVTPKNIDEHIAFAKKGGFRAMQIVWTAFASTIGHFPWQPEYINGMKDLQLIVRKINDAGMIAGAHFWYNKTMKNDIYVSPVPDYRLNLSRTFTLASSMDAKATTIMVEESPAGCTLDDNRRILKIGNELIEYTSYNNERPYLFTGCIRGILNTHSSEYKQGFKFGLIDVDTWPIWIRFDQRTSIQQEVAERIGKIYKDAGFQFAYFDGAEDVPPPYWYNTSMAQLKVYNCISPAPIFSEGALKSHFSWHILTRGNAFDVFMPEEIKEATRKHPLDEVRFVAQDFTSIDFGWINYIAPDKKTIGMQPDMLEYICSKATAWDCPISLQGDLNQFKRHPRTTDNLEVIRRWEEVRINNFFSEKQKKAMKDPEKEYILLVDENGKFELRPYIQILAGGDPNIRAFLFKRDNTRYWVVYWNPLGEGQLKLDIDNTKVRLFNDLGKQMPLAGIREVSVPLGNRHYLEFDLPREKVLDILKGARVFQYEKGNEREP